MNYCTKCESYYKNPGTCNCFATLRPTYTPQPIIPMTPYYPVWPSQTGDYWSQPYTISCGSSSGITTETYYQ